MSLAAAIVLYDCGNLIPGIVEPPLRDIGMLSPASLSLGNQVRRDNYKTETKKKTKAKTNTARFCHDVITDKYHRPKRNRPNP